MKKRFIFVLALILTLIMATPTLAATQLDVNGRSYDTSAATIIQEGVTMAPIDVLSHTLGCTVNLQGEDIAMQENQNILKMTIGSTLALLNDTEKQMPQPVQLINGQLYVPMRFVYESFGAVVNWEDAVKTVSVAYSETRNDMTAEEMLAESSRIMSETNRYKMAVDMNMDMDIGLSNQADGNDAEKMAMQMDSKMEGWIQASPILMYIKQDATVKPSEGATSQSPQNVVTEMLFNDSGIYMTMPEIGWVKMNLPGLNMQELLKQSMSQDPAAAMKQMKDLGLSVSFANDREKNGQKYWVIDAVMGGDIFKSDYFKQATQSLGISEAADMQKMLENMDADFYYSTWINQETSYTDFMEMQGNMKMNMEIPGEEGRMSMDMSMQGSYVLSDYGVAFQVPDVSNAVDFETAVNKLKPQQ